jgi:glycosyltransferase involved in cell wall biosynthesis
MRQFLPDADEVWAVSDDDGQRISALVPSARVVTVRSGMEPVVNRHLHTGDGRTILLVANYGYGPNEQGALWLIRDVWPRLAASWPDARLVLAGAGGSSEFVRATISSPAIERRGFVEDLAPLYRDASVVVVPVRTGSGTRLKVVDAWRHGKPVVSTRKGVEGLPAAPGAAIVTDDPDQFAAAAAALLMNANRRRQMGQLARRAYETCLSYDAIAAALPRHWHRSGIGRPEHAPLHLAGAPCVR